MIRIGHGFDVHAFGTDNPLIIGGVTIPFAAKRSTMSLVLKLIAMAMWRFMH